MASIADVVLPHELWIEIFKYLTTSDILNLCSVSEEHKYLLREKDVVKYFDIGSDFNFYNINIYSFIMQNVEYRFIKTLNINKFYWIPLQDLRSLLKYLPNLEELLALDTKLGLKAKDVVLYGKLQKLAITVLSRDIDIDPLLFRNNLYLLKKFCINICLKQEHFTTLYKLFNELIGLEELWINDTDDSIIEPIKYDYIVFKLKFLKKLVIKSKVNIPFLDYKPFGLAKFFETRRFKSIVMCYERYPPDRIVPYKNISIFEPFESEIEAAWDVIHKFQCEMPYGPKSAQEFYITKQIKNVRFEELNFFHSRCFCNPSFIKATLDFLKAENSKNLKKLSVKTCVLQRYPVSKENSLANLQERKYPIIDVIQNCKNLKTLELMACENHDYDMNDDKESTCNVTILDAYPFISNWVGLERLTVEVPAHLDGKFLKDVLMLCTKLKFLRLISYNTNEYLNISLYQALPYGSSLEDLCFETTHFNISRLFRSLNFIKNCKLRRMYLKALDSDSKLVSPAEEFLKQNDQLLFLYIVLTSRPQRDLYALQTVLNKYKNNPAKIYFAKKCLRNYVGNCPVTPVHKELYAYDTDVSSVDFYSFR